MLLPRPDLEYLMQSIRSDTEMLCQLEIMDYSLIIFIDSCLPRPKCALDVLDA